MNYNSNYPLINSVLADVIVYGFHNFYEVNIFTEAKGKMESAHVYQTGVIIVSYWHCCLLGIMNDTWVVTYLVYIESTHRSINMSAFNKHLGIIEY